MSEQFTDTEVRDLLRDEAEESGGVSAWAKLRGFSPQYVSGVIGGMRPLSPRILGELGLERVTLYIQKASPHGQTQERPGARSEPGAEGS